ncbi:DUF5686 and carboxypeptidase-like regulatory domain-containing protein [Gaoshiqia sp. Z1-71]|uniref:DUF5686 and carboxypeptidase-like regulatory domain-containing protein n=1 Tax=Gaoshiqia hydrogeniformans TaxID=3290090 RepID=UPI003BF800ED
MGKKSLSDGYSFYLNIHLLFLLLLLTGNSLAQSRFLAGTVADYQTGQPIPYVNIAFKGTMVGTTTDTLGYFKLKILPGADRIQFSAVGYYQEERVLSTSETGMLSVRMKPQTMDISEVRVAPDEGPIRRLLKQVVERKQQNNPDQYNRYSYQKYTKWEYQLNQVSDKIIQSKPFRNNQSLFKTEEGDSSKYLPLYFSEQLVFNEVQKEPSVQKSTVLADRTSGVGILDELEISGYTSALDMEVNFYDNSINLFTQNFISPVADNGWFFYNYFLADSAVVDGCKVYRVNFQPRRKHENTFKGYFMVEDRHYSVVEIDAKLSNTSNLNFLKSLRLKSNYFFVNDSTPFYKRNQIDALFDYIPFNNRNNKQPKRLSLFYTQAATIDQVTIDPPQPIRLSTPGARFETIKLPDATVKKDAYWDLHRLEPLSGKEEMISGVIDSISQIRAVSFINNLARMSMTGYYDIGKVELGPYTNFFNTNEVEGVHVFMGGRTSTEISEHWMFWGGLGYGFRNEKLSGMAGLGYKFPTINRRMLKVSYDDKMIRYGESDKLLYLYENASTATENNLVSQMLKHKELLEIFREQKAVAAYEHEWYPGLINKLTVSYTSHDSPEFFPFTRDQLPLKSVAAFEAGLDTRFSKLQKVVDNRFYRYYIESEHPVVHMTLAGGQAFYAGKSNWYGRVMATWEQHPYFGQTRFDYAIEAEKYFGKLPYSLLSIPRGNETYGLYTFDFNLLNYLEFVHDQYIRTYLEYHLNGFFFRRIPGLEQTRLREVLSAKCMVGSVSDKHRQTVDFPLNVTPMQNPYLELGAGVENILSMFQIQAIWRVHPASVVGAPSFGFRAKFEITL